MALFESYERRIDQINEVLNSYGIASIEEAEKITKGCRSGRIQSDQGHSADLFRERLLGIHRRRSNRNQEELQKGIRRCSSHRRRPSGILYPGFRC